MVINEDVLKWFVKEGYVEKDSGLWVRQSRYHTRAVTKEKTPSVAVHAMIDGTFDLEIFGDCKEYEVDVAARGLTQEFLISRGRGVEQRLVDAWNNLFY